MKDFFKFFISPKFLISLVVAIVLFFFLAWLTLTLIDKYTDHGVSVEVPEIRNMQVEEADVLLFNSDLKVEVNDSIFTLQKPPGVIVEQNPAPYSKIKKGRKVYVVINAKNKKKIKFPEIKEYPLRQAQSIITSLELKIGSIEYVPSEHENLVLYAKLDNKIVETGTNVPAGSKIVLVVGKGKLSDTKIRLQSYKGLTLEEAESRIFRASMNLGTIKYDIPPRNEADKKEYVVYEQSPGAGAEVNVGKEVNLWLTKNKSKLGESSDDDIDPDI